MEALRTERDQRDYQLWQQFQQNPNSSAVTELLFDRYGRKIDAVVREQVRRHRLPTSDQDDVYSEVIVKLIDRNNPRLLEFEWRCSLGYWLEVVVTNLARDECRRLQRRRQREAPSTWADAESGEEQELEIPDTGPSPEAQLLDSEAARMLFQAAEAAIAGVTPPKRQAIARALLHGGGMTPTQDKDSKHGWKVDYAAIATALRQAGIDVPAVLERAPETLSPAEKQAHRDAMVNLRQDVRRARVTFWNQVQQIPDLAWLVDLARQRGWEKIND